MIPDYSSNSRTSRSVPFKVRFKNEFLRGFLKNQWIILIFFAVVIIILGTWGFAIEAQTHNNIPFKETNFVYQSIQLFALEYGNVTEPSIQLEIARFCAPILTIYALALLLIKLFWSYILSIYLLIRRSPKIVICGLGYLGPKYMEESRARGYITVVIEKDSDTIAKIASNNPDIHFIKGDATDPEIIHRIHLKEADGVVIVTGDDTTNLQIAMLVRNEIRSTKKKKSFSDNEKIKITCLVHITDRWLINALKPEFNEKAKPLIDLFSFNMYHKAAEELVELIWNGMVSNDLSLNSPQSSHLLLIGYGTMGEEVTKEMICKWKDKNYYPDSKRSHLVITFIDYKDALDKYERLQLWMSENRCNDDANSITIYASDMKIPSATFLRGEFYQTTQITRDSGSFPSDCQETRHGGTGKNHNVPPITGVVICLADATAAITTALELTHMMKNRILPFKNEIGIYPPVYIRLIRQDGLEEFIDLLNNSNQYDHLIPFCIVEKGFVWNDDMEKKFPKKESFIMG